MRLEQTKRLLASLKILQDSGFFQPEVATEVEVDIVKIEEDMSEAANKLEVELTDEKLPEGERVMAAAAVLPAAGYAGIESTAEGNPPLFWSAKASGKAMVMSSSPIQFKVALSLRSVRTTIVTVAHLRKVAGNVQLLNGIGDWANSCSDEPRARSVPVMLLGAIALL